MEKSNKIESFLDNVSTNVFGRSRGESLKNDICVICGKPANKFKDLISKKEFSISGFCQICQDGIFG